MLIQSILTSPSLVLSSLAIGLLVAVVFQLFKFYSKVNSLPRGPFPLPVLGNILEFRNKGERLIHEVIGGLGEHFGPIFTFWTGPTPQVIILDAKLAKEALTKVEFAGRPSLGQFAEVSFGKDSTDIVFADFGREWEVLRKVAHSAVRKFAVNEKLPSIVDSQVKNFLREIKQQNGDEPFDPAEYLTFLMMSLLATSAFGREFTMSDSDFQSLSRAQKLQSENNNRGMLILFLPFLKYVFRKEYANIFEIVNSQRGFATRQYREHLASYTEGVIRDFMDAMICAKREAEVEDSNDSKYLKDQNIVNSVLDLFSAGSDTTKLTLWWSLLFFAEYPEYQRKIRQEVEDALGSDDVPTLEHRPQCNLLQAFIFEVMRIRPIIPLGVPHKTIADTEIAGHKIKKNVNVLMSIGSCLMDKETWGDPQVFRPERFLDANNKFNPKPNYFFVPFGGGRRVCLGEKLATANSFLTVAGLMHQTKGHFFTLPGGPGSVNLTPCPKNDSNCRPRPYKLILTPV